MFISCCYKYIYFLNIFVVILLMFRNLIHIHYDCYMQLLGTGWLIITRIWSEIHVILYRINFTSIIIWHSSIRINKNCIASWMPILSRFSISCKQCPKGRDLEIWPFAVSELPRFTFRFSDVISTCASSRLHYGNT